MKSTVEKKDLLSTALFIIYLLFFAGLIFSWRAVSSISTGLMLIVGFVDLREKGGSLRPKPVILYFYIACIVLFSIQAVLYMLTDHTLRGAQELQLKAGLLAVPPALFFSSDFVQRKKDDLQKSFLLLLLMALLICISLAIAQYLRHQDSGYFFYHTLVKPIHQHAVYFSLLVYFAILPLLENLLYRRFFFPRNASLCLLVFFIGSLILLSSKLVIAITVITLVSYLIRQYLSRRFTKKLLAVCLLLTVMGLSVLMLTRNPVSNRFTDLFRGDIQVTRQAEFHTHDYFNGLQFRLLQWQLVPAILNEQHAWIPGTGAGHSQDLLNQKYREKHMYTGDTGETDKGYALYNTHNQWLESLLKNGVFGLAGFFLLSLSLVMLAFTFRRPLPVTRQVVCILLLYCFTEAILETQYGLIIYIFFPLFFFFTETDNFVAEPSD
ncbi:MAG: O-antigen ligase family protein [Bacteroidetes bacterium]|nr:O-antigen ligase family protein [Bacteroidota bacterium]